MAKAQFLVAKEISLEFEGPTKRSTERLQEYLKYLDERASRNF
jgi:hypothetical protein